jgi:ABC-type cobalamin/Fe3+-siderophores transport system ATPase subunit
MLTIAPPLLGGGLVCCFVFLIIMNRKILKINDSVETEKRKIVFIGKNGSGKTALLNEIRKKIQNQTFIPSARGVHYLSPNMQQFSNMEQNLNSYLNSRTFVGDAGSLFITKFFGQYFNKMRNAEGENKASEAKYIDKLNKILQKLSPGFSEVTIDNFVLTLTKNYAIDKASDGERHAIVIICAVLSAEENGVILIDEPDIGIHNAALRDLFDILEEERTDCTFVYSTHNIQFAQTREDADVFYVSKNSSEYTKPTLKKIDAEGLDRDILIEINGVSKPVLLVEGNNTDRKLYSKIFKGFEVKNGDGCGQIVRRVKAIRDFYRRKDIFGLLDGDNRGESDEDELKKDGCDGDNRRESNEDELKKSGCFCIPFAQYEHLKILPDFIDSILKKNGYTDKKAIDIVIETIKSASDFKRHEESDEDQGEKIKSDAKSTKDKKDLIEFLKRYRGKDLPIVIETIKSAIDFTRHEKSDEDQGEKIKSDAKSIKDEKDVIEFLKRYRGKDLPGKIKDKIGISDNTLNKNMLTDESVEIFRRYLKPTLDEINEAMKNQSN